MSDRSLTDNVLTSASRSLTDDELDLLDDVLQASSGQPPALQAVAFYKENPTRVADLDRLVANQQLLLLEGNELRLMFAGLAVLRTRPSPKLKQIWQDLNVTYQCLRDRYMRSDESTLAVSIAAISETTKLDGDAVKALLLLLRDVGFPDGWSHRNESPDDVAELTEIGLLEFATLTELADHWADVVNPAPMLPLKDERHRTSERSAQVSVVVLGAALRAVANHRRDCMHGSNVLGAPIATFLDEHSLEYFGTTHPPLELEQIRDLCNKHLKLKAKKT